MANLSSITPFLTSQNLTHKLRDCCKLKPFNVVEFAEEVKSSTIFPLPKRYFGVEVEVENISHVFSATLPIAQYWNTVADGSLRNNGMEFVSHPIYGSHAETALDRLYTSLHQYGATVSPRTSVHVHINMRDATVGNLLNLLMIYYVFERVLYDFVGNERERNNFCIPLYAYPPTVEFFTGLLTQNFSTRLLRWLKYTGLNLNPLTKLENGKGGYGTVEFRHFSGSKDVEKVKTWISIILQMVKAAESHTCLELVNMLTSTNVEFMTSRIFQNFSYLFKDKPLQSLISDGVKDLLFILSRPAHVFPPVKADSPLMKVYK